LIYFVRCSHDETVSVEIVEEQPKRMCRKMSSLNIRNFATLYGIETRLKDALKTLVKEFPISSPNADINREIEYDTHNNKFKNSTRIEISGYFEIADEHEYHKLTSKLVKCFNTRLKKQLSTSIFMYPAIILKTTEDFGTHKFSLWFKIRINNKTPETLLSKLFKCNIKKKTVERTFTETVYTCDVNKGD